MMSPPEKVGEQIVTASTKSCRPSLQHSDSGAGHLMPSNGCKMLDTPPQTRAPSPGKTISYTPRELRPSQSLTQDALSDWYKLRRLREGSVCLLDGESLDLVDVVAVAKFGVQPLLKQDTRISEGIDASIKTLDHELKAGHLVYGVNTGFGGSASTRTLDLESLQRALLQHQNSGILSSKDIGRSLSAYSESSLRPPSDFETDFDVQSQPTSWVKASMLVRCNSIIRGHSAVRLEIAENILTLLQYDITPIVPLRGSISASGDLSPLSYIAGALEGNPDIFVRHGKDSSQIMTAQQALQEVGIPPVTLRAKEGLGLINGTAFSTATASLALHQAQELTVLSQILTAMGVEALNGTAESFWPAIALMRPHPGQIESAANILSFLGGSRLAKCVKIPKDTKMTGLYQDRYALRTASQWIGPQIEDLMHAKAQIKRELNSTTDNPLIDTETNHILHGGNFQAAVVTSTMDRTRLCIEKVGRLLFAQATELINPMLNNGLPANLSSDDPSLSFTCKGIDINMASYASELGFLANPVGNHVMSAEMHNQAVNSLALISSRYTFQALEVLRMMSAASLFILCQALDLRVLEHEFLEHAKPKIQDLITTHFHYLCPADRKSLQDTMNHNIQMIWPTTTTLDLSDRASKSSTAILTDLIPFLANLDFTNPQSQLQPLSHLTTFTSSLSNLLSSSYSTIRNRMYSNHLTLTPTYLGQAAKEMYLFVRRDLSIRFHRGLIEHPTQPVDGILTPEAAARRKTIGSQVSVIYGALRDGRVSDVAMRVVDTCVGSQSRC